MDDTNMQWDEDPEVVSEGKRKKLVRWSKDLVEESSSPPYYEHRNQTSPYVSPLINLSSIEFTSKMESVKDALGRWRQRVGEVSRKAEDLAGNTWQHLNTGPSFTDAALARIAQSAKVLAEGGYEKLFQQTFETVPEEELQNAFACYLSTSVGPVMGVLYVSTEKLAYASDDPLSFKEREATEWNNYKVTIPLHQLKEVNTSSSSSNSSEKYIQVISAGNHEFWFMGFLNYSVAVDLLKEVLKARSL